MGKSLIWGFIGPRGGGKSSSAAGLAALHMVKGGAVASNLEIKAPCGCVSHDVSLTDLASLDEKLSGALVVIDELPVLFNSKASQSVKNQLMGLFLAQSRKRSISLFYTAQNFMWVDNRIRYLTDVVVSCKDVAVLPYGRRNHIPEGQLISWRVWDHSGLMTGYPGRSLGSRVFKIGWTHDIYDTYQETDVWEGFSKVEVKKQRIVIDPYAEGGAHGEPQEWGGPAAEELPSLAPRRGEPGEPGPGPGDPRTRGAVAAQGAAGAVRAGGGAAAGGAGERGGVAMHNVLNLLAGIACLWLGVELRETASPLHLVAFGLFIYFLFQLIVGFLRGSRRLPVPALGVLVLAFGMAFWRANTG